MALLVFLLPARARAADLPTTEGTGSAAVAELPWVLSSDGVQLTRQGCTRPDQAPAADTVVAVLPASEVAWHRINLPKAPAAKLRAALGGLMEEQLLEDEAQIHLAVAPQAAAGASTWVAAVHKPWLQAQLAVLAAAGRPADRAVPAWAPSASPCAHFLHPTGAAPAASQPQGVWLALADADQALCLPLAGHGGTASAGGHAQALLGRFLAAGAAVSATPGAATTAERALGAAVPIRSDAEWALAAVQQPWQLLQFDLTPKRRGSRLLGSALQQLRSPAWRPVRWGLAALAAVQLVGLNVQAWQLQQDLKERRVAMTDLLRSAHPQVRAVLDAPVQMQRETALLREAAGVAGPNDFETLVGALAQAWPEGQPPATQLRYDSGRLSLPAAQFGPAQTEQLRQRLEAAGWRSALAEGQLSLQAAGPRTPSP